MKNRILAVCVGNICRSPMAERLLARSLPAADFQISSAGLQALVGSPMDPLARAELELLGGSADGFVARQVTPQMVEEADLILTATHALRSELLTGTPAALRRTFTMREFAELAEMAPDRRFAEVVSWAGTHRSRAAGTDLDVADPYRRGSEAHAAAARDIWIATTRIARVLRLPHGVATD